MIAEWKQGYEVVYAKRVKRNGESLFKKWTASLFYRVLRYSTDISIPVDTGDFRLIDRKVCEELKRLPEKNRFVRGLVSWVGFRQKTIEYERDERLAGETKYPLKRMIKLSGIESIIIVTGRNKKSIEDHFDKSVELEQTLLEKGKKELLREVQAISELASIHYIRQKEPLGLGHAILCAEQFIGDEPFAVLLGDDIMVSEDLALLQMMRLYEQEEKTIVGVQQVPRQEVHKYGIISSSGSLQGVHEVKGLVEKPSPETAPSENAIMGRYILESSIFRCWLSSSVEQAENIN